MEYAAMVAVAVVVMLAGMFFAAAARSRAKTPGGNHDMRRAGADPGAYDMRRDPDALRAAAAERFDHGDQAAARAGAGRKLTKHGHSGYVHDSAPRHERPEREPANNPTHQAPSSFASHSSHTSHPPRSTGPPPLRIPIDDLKSPPLRGGALGLVAVAGELGHNDPRAAELAHFIRTNQKIAAIKLYREMTGVDLTTAKKAVDALDLALNRQR